MIETTTSYKCKKRRKTMCEGKDCCQKPELLKDAPGNCTPEQIRICHGEMQGHPCTGKQEQTEQDD